MSPEFTGIIGLIVLLVLMFAGMDVGIAMACTGFLGLIYISGMKSALAIIAVTPYSVIAYYPFTVIPLFVLMGAIVSNTGMGSYLYNSAHKWFGQLRGGLAIATVAACAFFAAMCANSTAETITLGKVALREMKRFNYSDDLACGVVASGGTLGILIPPSIAFVVYGILTEQSIGMLFMAGIIPGILLSLAFIFVILVWSGINPAVAPAGEKVPLKEKIISLKYTWMALALFLLILGGIYLGIFTPTEAGAIGAFGSMIIMLIARKLNKSNLLISISEAGTTTASILILMCGAFIFMKFITLSKLPFFMADSISSLEISPYLVIAMIVGVYIILGMFMDVVAAIVLTVPLILPVVESLGFDPIWFGVVTVLLNEMGLITPPVGMNVFVLTTITNTPMSTMFRGVWPFAGAMLAIIIILIIWPQLVLLIPRLM
ncbi:MAG: TRAP transporter large permease [Deltaproteobacteria bacterium]|nr:TRAP transporter large permease [Deltaproteobacteria bacterium]